MQRCSRSILFALACAALSGCYTSPDDPCEGAACDPAVADLALSSLEVLSTELDSETGLSVVQPGSINVRAVVTNTSKVRSDVKPLIFDVGDTQSNLVLVPKLAPNETFTHTVRLDVPTARPFLLDTDTMSVTATLVALDENKTNNIRTSKPFHLAMPAVKIVARVDSVTLRANAAMSGSLTITNVGRHATLPLTTNAYCIHALGSRCQPDSGATIFDMSSTHALAPGQSTERSYPITVPSTATDQNRIAPFIVEACIGVGADQQPADLMSRGYCGMVRQVQVRPDYEACDPAKLTVDVVTQGSTVCRRPCTIHAYVIEAEAGQIYRIETPDGRLDNMLRWRTRYRDTPANLSSTLGFRPTASGTYYLTPEPKFCGNSEIQQIVLRKVTS